MSFGMKPVDIQTIAEAARGGAPGARQLLVEQVSAALSQGVPGAMEFRDELQREGLWVSPRGQQPAALEGGASSGGPDCECLPPPAAGASDTRT